MGSPSGTPGGFETFLVVDDDALFLKTVTQLLTRMGARTVTTATTLDEARALLSSSPELLLCDLYLRAEDGLVLVEEARVLPEPPAIIAMSGAAPAPEVFGLMAKGVSAFLEKPFTPEQLKDSLTRAKDARQILTEVARSQVGRVGAREAQQVVRETMFREALALTGGNRHAAARLLQVDRRLVQLMAKELLDPSSRRQSE